MSFVASLALRPAHGYVVLSSVSVGFVNIWAAYKVVSARKKYGIEYPQMYAEKNDKNAKAFNCIQRAHQNLLENIPLHLILQLLSGIHRPEVSAAFGFLRVAGFIAYVSGYSTGDPKERQKGRFGAIGYLALAGLAIEFGVRLLLDK